MFETLRAYGVIPVVAVESRDSGLRVCEALCEGGLPVAEITFRTEAAEETIKAATEAFPDMHVGAGTILSVDNLHRAVDAGATFGVSPGLNPAVVQAAVDRGFGFAPGVSTATDIEQALAFGLRELKFFPAEAVGGVTMLKALNGPYGHLKLTFCPTGGIKPENMLDYLELASVPVVGGSWLTKKTVIDQKGFGGVTELAREAVAAVRGLRGSEV